MGISINWYYADNDGNIGYVSPGHMPDRPEGQDPRLPVVGDGTMEWEGIRPFEENPRAFNPKQGYIANWNNQPGPAGKPIPTTSPAPARWATPGTGRMWTGSTRSPPGSRPSAS